MPRDPRDRGGTSPLILSSLTTTVNEEETMNTTMMPLSVGRLVGPVWTTSVFGLAGGSIQLQRS